MSLVQFHLQAPTIRPWRRCTSANWRAAGRGDPGPQHAWWRLGQIQAAADDVAAARASFQQALKLDPDLEEAEAELAKL